MVRLDLLITEVPPLTVKGLEAVGEHRLAKNHTVLELLF